MSEPAILAVGTRDLWRGVEVSDDGVPEMLGVFLLRLLRRYGGAKGVAEAFVSAPWGWRKLPTREANDSGWAPWFTPDDEHSRIQFLTWFILDVEHGRLEVYDVNAREWLEPVRLGADGRALNRPAWVPVAPRWLPTRPAQVDARGARILEELRKRGLSVERARAIVSTWMKGLVPQAARGAWQLWCGDDATSWSACRLGEQLLWIPDRTTDEKSYFELILSTEDCGVGFGSPSPEAWLRAVQETGVSRAKAGDTLDALFSAAVSPWAKAPVRVAVEGVMHAEPSGPFEALKQKLFKPASEPLRVPQFLELLPAIPREELARRFENDEGPSSVVEDEDGLHPARTFEPPHGWLGGLVRALSVPVDSGSGAVPERRRTRFWPYDEESRRALPRCGSLLCGAWCPGQVHGCVAALRVQVRVIDAAQVEGHTALLHV
ncbi:hypothetical protein [Pyxidicoccus sp. MSG2]|uniref:hypothetical protein n=1 Tax=Pyxidicoccus sp. MSG2 TaxID=2996790 RepID=UPI00226E5052|nr:hypothetical protein [Pyxidicoccus sp. MSG2]MCY1018174.1 hypothetical protein [Pyxidicoccus sp. MSG2]